MRSPNLPDAVGDTLRSVRDRPLLNRMLTSSARVAFPRRPPERLVRHLPRRGTVVVHGPDIGPVRFWSDGDDYITSRVWWMGPAGYEPETVAPFLRFVDDASVVVDLGAYTGYYSLLAAARNPAARIFAFEPHPRVAARLGRNLDLNPTLSITMVPMAVGAQRGVAPFHLGGAGLPLSSSLVPSWEGLYRTIPVAVTDLDSFVEEWGLGGVDVVKIDVEAGEEDVIRGMSHLLVESRPVLFTEILPGADRREMSDHLRRLDYDFYHLTFAGAVREGHLESAAGPVDHAHTPFNHLICPAERTPAWLKGDGRIVSHR